MNASHIRIAAALLGLCAAPAWAGGTAASFRSTEEIRYPTSYQTQAPQNLGGVDGRGQATGERPPVPSEFQTRETGTRLTVSDMPVATTTQYLLPAGKKAYTVQFPDGYRAQFVDGWVTRRDGVPYVGVGFVNGTYYARNLNTGAYARFRLQAPAPQARR